MIDYFLLDNTKPDLVKRLNEELKSRKIHSSQVFQVESFTNLMLRVWFRRSNNQQTAKQKKPSKPLFTSDVKRKVM